MKAHSLSGCRFGDVGVIIWVFKIMNALISASSAREQNREDEGVNYIFKPVVHWI
ncbi:MAG: hypothetical protein HOO06_07675 [Bdellovibrionaceae bacterium]|nr:hypothetical protein [Pseudobdellovibrionaceae bacterium]